MTVHHSDMQSQVLKARAAEHLATYQHLYSVTDLEEAISMYEEVLRLRPEGHELRAESLNDLGCALHDFCYLHEANETRITRCIELLREGLRLRPPQHPLRDQSLYNLAKSLRCVLYRQVGGLEILKECELLNREALRLRPPGHPDRTYSMNVLANDLGTIVWHTGDTDMQAEMVDMRREVLGMCPPGHPLRDTALENLGYALRINFERMGRSELLAEAISVTREAVQICPLGHPRRGILLSTLSYALMLRYGYEGHAQSLPEAIGLVRGALQLMPDNHPARAGLLSNLAEALLETWRGSRDGNALAEAVSLLREAMALRSPGAESYHTFVNNLAETLEASYNTDGDIKTLSEVTDLYRQALHSRPTGHPLRFLSLEGLARALSKSGSGSWPEVLSCYKEALKICPVGYPARARLLSGMSRCFLDSSSLLFSLSEGISCLSQAYADTLSHVRGRLKSAISDLQQLEAAYGVTTKISHSDNYFDNDERILSLYVQVIHLLPLAANFGLDHGARLQAVAGSDEIARNAAARAVIIGYFPQAVEMLEQGRGVFWTQTLHLRTAAFSGVPQDDYQELKRMLQLLEHGARRVESLQQSVDQREREMEERRRLNEAVQALISKIRGYPGYDRFLLPPAFDALMGSLPEGFVIIVNASKLGNHALLLHRTTGLARTLVLQPFRAGFDCTDLRAQLPRDMSAVSASRQVIDDATRAMRLDSGKTRCFEDVLSLLWTSVVHPIFGALGLHVGFTLAAVFATSDHPSSGDARARSSTTLVVRNRRIRLPAYPCCRELSRRDPGVHGRLRGLVVHSNTRLAHQGEESLDTHRAQRPGRAPDLRGVDNRRVSGKTL
jgi:tetratricopeptide (TPR) repeat protein